VILGMQAQWTVTTGAGGRHRSAIHPRPGSLLGLLLVVLAIAIIVLTGFCGVAAADRHHAGNPAVYNNYCHRTVVLSGTQASLPDDRLSRHWALAPSAESDTPDVELVLTRRCRVALFFARDPHVRQRSLSERPQMFTPLYLAHKSLLC
jgi:hypothetical protein